MSEIKAKAWTYNSVKGDLLKDLTLSDYTIPATKDDHVLLEILNSSLNPGDFKFPKLPIVKWLITQPASPCWDFCGRIRALPAGFTNDSRDLKVGQVVWGMHRDLKDIGTLKTILWVHKDAVYPLPENAETRYSSAFGVGALTAYQAIAPYAKPGGKLLVNGGAGGVGTFCIQVGKALGLYVAATCSEAGAQLCRGLGADEILDYKSPGFEDDLIKNEYDIVVDVVGYDPTFHSRSERFMKPDGQFVLVGLMDNDFKGIWSMLTSWALPVWLGGVPRKWKAIFTSSTIEDYKPVADLVSQGKLKVAVDSVFPFEDAPKAFERVKSGRAKGKVLVDVASYHS